MQNFIHACNRIRTIFSIRWRMLGMIMRVGLSKGVPAYEIQQLQSLKHQLDMHRLDLGKSRLDRVWR